MADGTAIEWTDATWNPVTGCSRVSAGCQNCYAERLAATRLRDHPSRKGLTDRNGPVDVPDGMRPPLDWVVAGGESGPGARLMHPDWARSLRDQCAAAGVPFFFKQWGGPSSKSGGRLLDGRAWDAMPGGHRSLSAV